MTTTHLQPCTHKIGQKIHLYNILLLVNHKTFGLSILTGISIPRNLQHLWYLVSLAHQPTLLRQNTMIFSSTTLQKTHRDITTLKQHYNMVNCRLFLRFHHHFHLRQETFYLLVQHHQFLARFKNPAHGHQFYRHLFFATHRCTM